MTGAGKAVIELPETLFPIESFGSVHDELYVRALMVKADLPFIIVCFDATSLRPYAISQFQAKISQLTDIPITNIWVCVSHTFSAPHLRSEEALAREGGEVAEKNKLLFAAMEAAMEAAVTKARDSLEETQIISGKTFCNVNVNRDMLTANGWWLGADDQGQSDKTVPFVKFISMDGQEKAVLYGYDVQSSIMDHSAGEDGFGKVTGDLAGAASRYIEKQYGDGFVAIFLLGAAGDQAPLFKARQNVLNRDGSITQTDIGDDGFVFVDSLGQKLGEQVVRAMEQAALPLQPKQVNVKLAQADYPGQKIARDLREIQPTKAYDFQPDEDHAVAVSYLSIGGVALAGLAPELSSATASSIKEASPYQQTFVVTMVNGGDKYMPDKTAYDRITYEAMNSKYAKGAAEALAQDIIKNLSLMKEEEGTR